MSKGPPLAPLAEKIVSRTPARSYSNREHLSMVLFERNYRRLGGRMKAVDILTDMVEARLIKRDGYAYADCTKPTGE